MFAKLVYHYKLLYTWLQWAMLGLTWLAILIIVWQVNKSFSAALLLVSLIMIGVGILVAVVAAITYDGECDSGYFN